MASDASVVAYKDSENDGPVVGDRTAFATKQSMR